MKPRRFMVTLALLCVMSCVMLCVAVSSDAATRPQLAVYLRFDHSPSPASLEQMERETAAIMEPAGLELVWRKDTDRREDFPRLVVVHFGGSCTGAPALYGTYSPEAQAAALASTAISDGRVLPFSSIECDEIRRYIARADDKGISRETLFGRAVGRVMAHEMYHMLLRDTRHAADGVARAYHRREELTAPAFRFQPHEIQRLRASLTQAVSESERGTTRAR